ncbi:MAG: hypothetical protein ABI592_11915 [Acidobacteriota bacterium]
MKRHALRAIAAGIGSLVLVGWADAQPIGSGHWKSTIEVEGGQRDVGPINAELWMKQGKFRMKNTVMGMNMNLLHANETTWQWSDAQKTGMKFSSAAGPRQQGADYASRIDEYRKGKKIGSEKLDGHPCDIMEVTTAGGPGGDRKETVWLANDLRGFPVKVIMEANGTKTTSHNTEIDLNASVPDSLLTPPSDVQFQDMSEMMKRGMPPPKGR